MLRPRYWPLAFISEEDEKDRLDLCRECPSFRKAIAQCKECGCFMPLKVKVFQAECPKGKW